LCTFASCLGCTLGTWLCSMSNSIIYHVNCYRFVSQHTYIYHIGPHAHVDTGSDCRQQQQPPAPAPAVAQIIQNNKKKSSLLYYVLYVLIVLCIVLCIPDSDPWRQRTGCRLCCSRASARNAAVKGKRRKTCCACSYTVHHDACVIVDRAGAADAARRSRACDERSSIWSRGRVAATALSSVAGPSRGAQAPAQPTAKLSAAVVPFSKQPSSKNASCPSAYERR
jgi:hypothetical protein